jgi:hypothetical protein
MIILAPATSSLTYLADREQVSAPVILFAWILGGDFGFLNYVLPRDALQYAYFINSNKNDFVVVF